MNQIRNATPGPGPSGLGQGLPTPAHTHGAGGEIRFSENDRYSNIANSNSNTVSSRSSYVPMDFNGQGSRESFGSILDANRIPRRSVSSSPHQNPRREIPPHIYQTPLPTYAHHNEVPIIAPQEPDVIRQPTPPPHPNFQPMQHPQYLYPPPLWQGQFPAYGMHGGGHPMMNQAPPYHMYPYMHFPPPAPPAVEPQHVPHTLPTTTHISILTGQSDFAVWHDGVKALIRHLKGFGHIASLADPIVPHRPDLNPTDAPVITGQSTQLEIDECTRWWDLDNVVQHVLLARLGPSVRMILPEESVERTARDIYQTLKSNYGANRRSEGTNIFLEVLAVRCNPSRLRDYVSAWQNAVTKMRSCRFMVPGYILSLLFVKNLPDSLAFGSLRSNLGARLENVKEADMEIFKEVQGNVLELDAQFKSVSSVSLSRNPSNLSSRGTQSYQTRSSQTHRSTLPPSIDHQADLPTSCPDLPTSNRPAPSNTVGHLLANTAPHGGGFSRRPDGRTDGRTDGRYGAPRAYC